MTPGWQDADPEVAALASDVCDVLADYVTAIVPRGAVERPDASVDVEFLIALVEWERDPSDESTDRLRIAFFDVMDAWWEVARGHAFRPMEA